MFFAVSFLTTYQFKNSHDPFLSFKILLLILKLNVFLIYSKINNNSKNYFYEQLNVICLNFPINKWNVLYDLREFLQFSK